MLPIPQCYKNKYNFLKRRGHEGGRETGWRWSGKIDEETWGEYDQDTLCTHMKLSKNKLKISIKEANKKYYLKYTSLNLQYLPYVGLPRFEKEEIFRGKHVLAVLIITLLSDVMNHAALTLHWV